MKKLIDTHCHVYSEEFEQDMEGVIARAVDAGIGAMLMPAVNPNSLPQLLAVSERWPDICYPMIGLHPEDLSQDFHSQLNGLKAMLDEDQSAKGRRRFIGIGETGLDLYWDKTRLDDQIESFRVQIEWALEYDLPIVIHSRESFQELYNVLSDYRNSGLRGVFHCFSGSVQEASALMEFHGFMFGIGGVLTFRRSSLPQVVPFIPRDRILLETDCPYLAPVPCRGKRNEPSFMVHTAQALADACSCTLDEVVQFTTANARTLFGI